MTVDNPLLGGVPQIKEGGFFGKDQVIFNPDVAHKNTQMLVDRVEADYPGYYKPPTTEAPNGLLMDRAIIGHDMPVNKGVYPGSGKRELIVVDDTKDPIYNDIYQKVETAIGGSTDSDEILKKAFQIVNQVLPNNEKIANDFAVKFKDKKVNLADIIKRGGGVCRHKALLLTYLSQRLITEGKIKGTASIDRNTHEGKGAHAWVRFTDEKGDILIMDPTLQGKILRLEDIKGDEVVYARERDGKYLQDKIDAQQGVGTKIRQVGEMLNPIQENMARPVEDRSLISELSGKFFKWAFEKSGK